MRDLLKHSKWQLVQVEGGNPKCNKNTVDLVFGHQQDGGHQEKLFDDTVGADKEGT